MALPQATPPPVLALAFAAEPEAVRLALAQVTAGLAAWGTAPDAQGRAEQVLAEVLNNIVEHAYAGACGDISLRIDRCDAALVCRVVDSGRPMPGGQMPPGRLLPHDPADLAEGGYGWHLIRSLARELRYARRAGQNLLTFEVPLFADDA